MPKFEVWQMDQEKVGTATVATPPPFRNTGLNLTIQNCNNMNRKVLHLFFKPLKMEVIQNPLKRCG